MQIRRGEIYWAHLDPVRGSEQAGRRPVLIIQNNTGNDIAPTTIVAPLTTQSFSKEFPVNVNLPKGTSGLAADSTVLLSQIRTLDKTRLQKRIGHLSEYDMDQIDKAIKVSLGL